MYRYTLRFNLGAGKNFKKVKVTDKVKLKSDYLEPEGLCLSLTDCRLVNQKSSANKIFSGTTPKQVCAWVSASKVEEVPLIKGYAPIYYNPKVSPNWRDSAGNNIDGMLFNKLYMVGRQLYASATVTA